MQLVRFSTGSDGRVGFGVVQGAVVRPLTGWTLDDVIDVAADDVRLEECELLAPIERPGKILGSGINYRSHLVENPHAVMPTRPGFFSKFPSAVIGPNQPIVMPTSDTHLDYEVELAVVIGRRGKDLTPSDAMSCVRGYTVVNDVSARDIQFAGQVDLAKGCDTFCPMGPALVTTDEIPDPAVLAVRSWVNGELRQEASVGDLIFDVPTLLCAASAHITLEPGDVIMTGTPAGSGAFREPPQWLAPGDVVRVAIDGIGELCNPVAAESGTA